MKKPIVIGLIIMSIGIAIGIISNSRTLTIEICGIAGLLCFAAGGITNGAFINGDSIRNNYSIDNKEDRLEKSRISNFVIVIGLPNIILAIILLLYK